MTKAEAIDVLEIIRSQVEWEYPMDYSEAIDKAISALRYEDILGKCEGCKSGECEFCIRSIRRSDFYEN